MFKRVADFKIKNLINLNCPVASLESETAITLDVSY